MEVYTGKGGRRPGSGRKPGESTGLPSAARIFSEEKAEAVLEIAEARAKKESYLAHLAEIEYKQKRGQLISEQAVFQVIETAASAFREQLLSIPGRYASIFAAESNAKTIEHVLENELRKALEQVTNVKNVRFGAQD